MPAPPPTPDPTPHQTPDPTREPWAAYATAVVEVTVGDERFVLTPTAVASGTPPGPDTGLPDALRPLWVVTAADPYPQRLTPAQNAARNARLRAELEGGGLRVLDALGRAPDGSTAEVSLAVTETDRATVLAHAADHDQLAVYEIDDRIRCVSVDGAHEVTARPYTTSIVRRARRPR